MPRVCVLGCRSKSVSFHVFPNPNKFPEIFKAWVDIVGGKLETPSDFEIYEKKRICDIHFTDRDKNRNNRLNALAVPSLFLGDNRSVNIVPTPEEVAIKTENDNASQPITPITTDVTESTDTEATRSASKVDVGVQCSLFTEDSFLRNKPRNVDIKSVIRHIVKGTMIDNLCRVCLCPLNRNSENVFTKICKKNKQYCIADVFEKICQIKIPKSENWDVCSDCFITASVAYKFYLTSKRNEEILNYYISELAHYANSIEVPDKTRNDSLWISLPLKSTETQTFDYDIYGVASQHNNSNDDYIEENSYKIDHFKINRLKTYSNKRKLNNCDHRKNNEHKIDLIDVEMKADTKYIDNKISDGKRLKRDETNKKDQKSDKVDDSVHENKSTNGGFMEGVTCTRCVVIFTDLSELIAHAKTEHNVDVFVCKKCKELIEGKEKYREHLKIHTVYKCYKCSAIYPKLNSLLVHFEKHKKDFVLQTCKMCGHAQYDRKMLEERNYVRQAKIRKKVLNKQD